MKILRGDIMKKHIFHLVLNTTLKKQLTKLSRKLKLSISKTIIHILDLSLPIIEKFQQSCKEVNEISKYNKISWDSHVHINFDENLYRKIKHICDTMFAFSTAIVLRKLLSIYFKKINKYKKYSYNKVLLRYKNIYINNTNRQKYFTIQLYKRIYYQLSYNNNFNLVEIKFNAL
jgi:hypothetical protein